MNHKANAEDIFRAGVRRVMPDSLIHSMVNLDGNCLRIGDLNISADNIRHTYIIGAGKASAMMAAEIEKILGSRIKGGHIVVKYGHSCALNYINVTEAGHPVPDANGFLATQSIVNIAKNAGEDDLVINLISGGGSALLADYPEGAGPEDIMKVNELLVNSGANIKEINIVRKHLSDVKGGRLAKHVYPASMVNLIISDVPGDPLDVIASGPSVADPTTFEQALEVLEKYSLIMSAPKSIVDHIKKGKDGLIDETPKPGDEVFKGVRNFIIGNNRVALEASGKKANELGYFCEIVDDKLEGDINNVADYIIEKSIEFQTNIAVKKPACLLFGGEPTLRMTGKGKGGRNQHLALLCALKIHDKKGITILSAGTDGTDGPTDAAGAIIDCKTVSMASSGGIDPESYLRKFDSWNFFREAGGHIITGPTMTNVMDIIVAIVE